MVNELQDKARIASKRHEEYRKDSEKQIEDLQVENSRLMEAVVQQSFLQSINKDPDRRSPHKVSKTQSRE